MSASHLRLLTDAQQLRRRDHRLLTELSELHVDLNDATEALRAALAARDPEQAARCGRRLLGVGLLFGDAVRKAGYEI